MLSQNETPAHQKTARQRILEAAAHAFRTQGYARTTTKAIAAQAGVAEVTLFRHFESKQKLFQAVVQHIGRAAGLDELESRLIGDLRADLSLIGRYALSFFTAQREIIQMLMFEASHFPEIREALAQNPRALHQLLSRYFEQQIARGQMRPFRPAVMAETFISMLFGYAIGLEPIQEFLPPETSPDEMVEPFVHIFLEGTAAKD